jgi:hypothetical protein
MFWVHFFSDTIPDLKLAYTPKVANGQVYSLFGWLVADGRCWFVLREEYCWLVAGGWFCSERKILLAGGW